jgi:predicted small metal-binding protein
VPREVEMRALVYAFDDFAVKGRSDDEVLRSALEHMKRKHPEMMKGILEEMSEGEFMEALQPDIKEVADAQFN